MTSDRRARIRHLAGRIAAEICWPDPDLTPEALGQRITSIVVTWPDFPTALAGLATAGPLTIRLMGATPDVGAIADELEPTTMFDDEWQRTGHDIGVGFARHAMHPTTTGHAVDFFITTISNVPETHRDVVLVHAIATIVSVYTWAALTPR